MDPFLGELRAFPWNWAPKGWHLCDGSLLPIQQYAALFSLLGTQYGGNGQTNFALPDLRGRVPIHFGSVYSQGEIDGSETELLQLGEMPIHNHTLMASSTAGQKPGPTGNVLAQVTPTTALHYSPDTTTVALNPASIQPGGGNQPHANMQPYLVLNYCIAMVGIFPSRN